MRALWKDYAHLQEMGQVLGATLLLPVPAAAAAAAAAAATGHVNRALIGGTELVGMVRSTGLWVWSWLWGVPF